MFGNTGGLKAKNYLAFEIKQDSSFSYQIT